MGGIVVDNKTVFITGCGSLAKALTNELIRNHNPHKVVLFSRDEYLQEIAKGEIDDPKGVVRYFIGDVRDSDRLGMAMRGVDLVVHTAALKRVETCEYNPIEAVRTNVLGAVNVVASCIINNVQRAVFTTTDKAVMPINLYGMCKGVAEKLWIYSNFYKPIFSCVRYGNVMGSRGSILPLYEQCADARLPFPITDTRMTRFWVRMEEAVKLVIHALEAEEGYTYILKSPTFKITDLAMAMDEKAELSEVGMRPGEKLHETLVSQYEATRIEDRGWYYALQPEIKYSEKVWPECTEIAPIESCDWNVDSGEIKKWLK